MGDGENPPSENFDFAMAYDDLDMTQKIQHLMLANLGFAFSIISCSSFLRDIPMIIGSSIILGYEMAGNIRMVDEDA